MAATFEFNCDHGTQTGSPLKGTTRSTAVGNVNWKAIDDGTTAYSSSPILASTNSFEQYQFGKFTGTFSLISNAKFAHTAGAFGTGLTLKGIVTSTYATPSQTTNAALTTDMTSAISIGSGAAVLFHTTGPEGASPTSTLAAAGYTQFLVTQLQVGSGAGSGDTTSATLTLVYDES